VYEPSLLPPWCRSVPPSRRTGAGRIRGARRRQRKLKEGASFEPYPMQGYVAGAVLAVLAPVATSFARNWSSTFPSQTP
jgi:hypothetical protein